MKAVYHAWLVCRSAMFWLWMILCTLVLGVPVMLGALISYDLGYRLCRLWLSANLHGLRIICGLRWKVSGRENIPEQACIVMAKHQSTWETYFLPMMLGQTVYVAKRSLAWIPLFGWSLYLLGFILIDRKSGSSAIAQMVEQSRTALSLGRWIIVFPEGTRKAVGAPPDYRIGGALVAKKTGAAILPVALNAGVYWPRMGFIKWPGTIHVHFGPPIGCSGKSASAILAETEHWIESAMLDMPGIDKTASSHPPQSSTTL